MGHPPKSGLNGPPSAISLLSLFPSLPESARRFRYRSLPEPATLLGWLVSRRIRRRFRSERICAPMPISRWVLRSLSGRVGRGLLVMKAERVALANFFDGESLARSGADRSARPGLLARCGCSEPSMRGVAFASGRAEDVAHQAVRVHAHQHRLVAAARYRRAPAPCATRRRRLRSRRRSCEIRRSAVSISASPTRCT